MKKELLAAEIRRDVLKEQIRYLREQYDGEVDRILELKQKIDKKKREKEAIKRAKLEESKETPRKKMLEAAVKRQVRPPDPQQTMKLV